MPVMESLFKIPEGAKLANISPRMLQKLIASERAPEVVRIGRAVRMRASDLHLWIQLGCPPRHEFNRAKAERASGSGVKS